MLYQDTQWCVVQPKKLAATPLSILTGRTKMQFSRTCTFTLLLQNWPIFAVEMSSIVSTPHSKLWQKFWGKIQTFKHFFFLLSRCLSCPKMRTRNQVPWNLEATSWYQVWFEYGNNLQNYLRLFTQNNSWEGKYLLIQPVQIYFKIFSRSLSTMFTLLVECNITIL